MNILLIHGLGRTPLSMMALAQDLSGAGHQTDLFGYFTWLHSFDDIAGRLRDRITELAALGPYGIVSHSMGGLLTRAALAPREVPQPQHVVMLAPPNQPPRLARLAHKLPPFRWFAQQSGNYLASPDFYATLTPLRCPYTLIAGTSGPRGPLSPFGEEINDAIVSLTEVKMRPTDAPVQIPAFHSWIMLNPEARAITLSTFAA